MALGNIKKISSALRTVSSVLTLHYKWHYILKFRIIFVKFAIFNSFISLKAFFRDKSNLNCKVIRINEYNEWKNDIDVIESNVRPYLDIERKIRISCSEYMTMNLWPNCFKFHKNQMKSENHEICHDIICGGYDKKLRRFHKSYHVCCV